VIKIRLQLQSHSLSDPASLKSLPKDTPVYKGIISTARKIVGREGFTALWKGNIPAELMYMVYSGVQFTTYRATAEFIRPYFVREGQRSMGAEARITGVAGTAAGLAGTLVSYPLDLLRTRFAAQGESKVYKHFWLAIGEIRRVEGVRGLFRGIAPTILNSGPGMGIYFFIYEAVRPPDVKKGEADSNRRRVLPKLPGGFDKFLAGSTASMVAKTIVFPFDLVRKRMQVQGPTRNLYVHKNIPEYTGTVSALRSIFVTEGFRGMYRGLAVTLLKHAPSSGVTLWVYEVSLRGLMTLDAPPAEKPL